ncbi:MAG: class I SAM-dependent methyltransferase [Thermoanaerobaculia bacterium]
MLPRYTFETLTAANLAAAEGSVVDAYARLRTLPLADFCSLHVEVPGAYPALRSVLPVQPPEKVQKRWTGDSGSSLMRRSCATMRLMEVMKYRVTGRGTRDCRILDYGCGWGRLLRLANYFSPVDRVYGVDVMEASLKECDKGRVPNRTALVAAAPAVLPFDGEEFDLVFAFSVFTHIPAEVAKAVLQAVRARVAPESAFIITIRSHEFWSMREGRWPRAMVEGLRREHEQRGYAFQTFEGSDVNDSYGDTTMSFDFLDELAAECGWRMAAVDRDLLEPLQIGVALVPR